MSELTPGWRKSSYSASSGGANCVEAGAVPWRKSSYSINSGGTNCVEAGSLPGQVLIRDTKEGGRGAVLRVSAETWRAFTTAIRANAAR
jgi:hypothetical protein